MQTIDQNRTSSETAVVERPKDGALFVATCRANPKTNDGAPLGAGDYKVAWAYPTQAAENQPITFTYDDWQPISHVKKTEQVAGILPPGDVLVVVHGFHETAPEGVLTGQTVATGLAPQKRTGGISKALSGGKPASQDSALRLAKTIQNLMPTTPSPAAPPLYDYLIPFTWPCAHSVFPGYLLDKEEVARYAAFSLANLLADLRASQPERRILLVAHSMGCFLTIKALNMLAVLRPALVNAAPLIVDQMAFYAPDLNADALQYVPLDLSGSGDDLSATLIARQRNGYGFEALDRVGRLTIYYSFHDNALVWSPFANLFTEESDSWVGRARLGWCGPYDLSITHRNVVAVDCSACIFDHSAYFIRHEVLEHTTQMLAEKPLALPQLAYQATALRTSVEGAQQLAKRLWTWYTPAEIAREQWEFFFLRKSRGARWLTISVSLLLFLAAIAAIIFALVSLAS